MTEVEKLREEIAEWLALYENLGSKRNPMAADIIARTFGLSWTALAWCRANPELVEALARRAWQAVPVIADQNMVAAINTHHDSASNSGDAVWQRALEAAPKKPEE